MISSAPRECNWCLLFDIALSHGDSLRRQRLLYSGFLTLLRYAGISAPETGVYRILLEALWHTHGQSPESIEHGYAVKRSQTVHDLSVDLDGFIAVMNVVCVRCFQTHLCSELTEGKRPISEIIVLSAEDQVKLKESVEYAARRFFKPLISRCTVSKKMVVSLDPSKNNWTPYTNQFVTHVVAKSTSSVILPLFYRYAKEGRIKRAAYEHMLKDVFPKFTPVQMKSAQSIFDYQQFFGIHHLAGQLRIESINASTVALELDSFLEALLMLTIVAFSDETVHKHHRPITAKVWSTFEEYYCKFLALPMIEDPILNNRFAQVLPRISLVFPSRVPLDKVSSFIIGGWNLTVDRRVGESVDVAQYYPPRILQPHEENKEKDDAGERRVSVSMPSSSAGLAFKLFEEEFSRKKNEEQDLPLYGMRRCTVYVDEHKAVAVQRGPNRVEVMIPLPMWDVSIKGTQVHFVEHGEGGKLTLCPITKAAVSLRNMEGNTIFSSMDVFFVMASLVEIISASQMKVLKDVFSRYSAEDGMPLDRFDEACAELCIDKVAAQPGGCSSFLEVYLREKEGAYPAQSDDVNSGGNLSFSAFFSAVATLLLQKLETNRCLPNIPYLLGVALSCATPKLSLPSEQHGIAPSLVPRLPHKPTQPHNARIDVPYTNVLRKKSAMSGLHSSAEGLIKVFGKETAGERLLPDFSLESDAVSIVLQHEDEEGLLREVRRTSLSLRDIFLKKEMVVCHQGWKAE